ncbi:MAG: hypothetical protein A3I10_03355 [Deltaproteobacteria bacterium RIFCSPLOWO2_02_FULL_57_26]|nr:MAG: hypothetical protein A3I10_03355 [Deltaproteobacteria bacterium RIFCSPLOWO2_02_FULL_57_26]
MLSIVEAFIGFFSRIAFKTIHRPCHKQTAVVSAPWSRSNTVRFKLWSPHGQALGTFQYAGGAES